MTDKHDVMPCPDGDLCPNARRYGKIHPKPNDPKTTTIQRLHAAVDQIEPMLQLALAQLQAGDFSRCIGSLHVAIDEVRKLETESHA